MFYNKRKKLFISYLIFAIFVLYNFNIYGESKPKIFLLGIKSPFLNDIESRLLREKILRELQANSYPIVPIMKFENYFRNKTESQILQNGQNNLENYCEIFNTNFAFLCEINFSDSISGSKKIKAGKKYTVKIIVYNKKKDDLREITFETSGEKNYYLYFNSIAGKVVKAFTALLKTYN